MLEITKEQIEEAEKNLQARLPRDIPTALADCGDAFETLRYVYETGRAKFYITHLPLVLRKVIQSITKWT
jgi:hypothetical protein